MVLSILNVYAIKEVAPIEGNVLSLDNRACELINKKFEANDEEVLVVQGKTLTVKYLGAKKIDNMKHYDDYSQVSFLKKGDSFLIEDETIIPIWEINGELYEDMWLYFGYNLNLFDLQISDRPETEGYTNDDGVWTEKYLGYVTLDIDESSLTKDCEGLYFKEYDTQWDTVSNLKYYKSITLNEGWNLIPRNMEIPQCSNFDSKRICSDNTLVYYFDSISKQYHSENEISNFYDDNIDSMDDYYDNFYRDYINELEENGFSEDDLGDETLSFNDFSFLPSLLRKGNSILNTIDLHNRLNGLTKESKWVYVKEKDAGKYLMNELNIDSNGLMGAPLFKGWNIQHIYPELVFEEEITMEGKIIYHPVSLNDFKGDCNLEKGYIFDSLKQNWEEVDFDYQFTEEDIYKGLVLRVQDDCRLASSIAAEEISRKEIPSIPAIPNN